MAFADVEKVRLRHHLGYLNVAFAQTFALGIPTAVETQFLIEGAMNRVLPAAESECRRLVGILDKIECQMVDDQELLAVEKVDEIGISAKEMPRLRIEYQHWQRALGNLLGVPPNPYDQRFGGYSGGSGLNASVCH
jgi:hypothetical protein